MSKEVVVVHLVVTIACRTWKLQHLVADVEPHEGVAGSMDLDSPSDIQRE